MHRQTGIAADSACGAQTMGDSAMYKASAAALTQGGTLTQGGVPTPGGEAQLDGAPSAEHIAAECAAAMHTTAECGAGTGERRADIRGVATRGAATAAGHGAVTVEHGAAAHSAAERSAAEHTAEHGAADNSGLCFGKQQQPQPMPRQLQQQQGAAKADAQVGKADAQPVRPTLRLAQSRRPMFKMGVSGVALQSRGGE